MKRTILMVAALALAAPLGGCGTMLSAAGVPAFVAETATTPVCARTVRDNQAAYGAEALYNVPAAAYVSALKRGLVSDSVKAVVKPKLQLLYGYLRGARAAKAACDEATFLNYKHAMEVVKADVLPLIPH
jgi:hypothetical protein